jgi:hypothetical protein
MERLLRDDAEPPRRHEPTGLSLGSHPLLLALTQLPNPDIPETNGVVVLLQPQRHPLRVWLVRRPLLMCSWARQFDVVLDQNSVVKDRDKSGAKEFPVFVKTSIAEDEIVSLRIIEKRRQWAGAILNYEF